MTKLENGCLPSHPIVEVNGIKYCNVCNRTLTQLMEIVRELQTYHPDLWEKLNDKN